MNSIEYYHYTRAYMYANMSIHSETNVMPDISYLALTAEIVIKN